MQVDYRPIRGFEGYRVGNDGSVWTRLRRGRKPGQLSSTWRPMKLQADTNGYKFVTLSNNGSTTTISVHRIVLEAFAGLCPDGCQARHFPDPDKTNNALSNLSWATPAVNAADKIVQGGYSPCISEAQAHEAIKLLREGTCTIDEIAAKFNVSDSTIYLIARGQTWTWLSGGPISRQRTIRLGLSRKLTEEDVIIIRDRAAAGVSYAQLAREFSVSNVSILHIARGNSWPHVGGPLIVDPRKRGRPIKCVPA